MMWPGGGMLWLARPGFLWDWGSILPEIPCLEVGAVWMFSTRSWNDCYKRSYIIPVLPFTDKRTQVERDFSFLLSHEKIIMSRTGFLKVIFNGNITHTGMYIRPKCMLWWIATKWIYPCNYHPDQEIEHYPLVSHTITTIQSLRLSWLLLPQINFACLNLTWMES